MRPPELPQRLAIQRTQRQSPEIYTAVGIVSLLIHLLECVPLCVHIAMETIDVTAKIYREKVEEP